MEESKNVTVHSQSETAFRFEYKVCRFSQAMSSNCTGHLWGVGETVFSVRAEITCSFSTCSHPSESNFQSTNVTAQYRTCATLIILLQQIINLRKSRWSDLRHYKRSNETMDIMKRVGRPLSFKQMRHFCYNEMKKNKKTPESAQPGLSRL